MNFPKRERSYWIFSKELKDSNIIDENDDKYIITPLGSRLRRLFIAGSVTYKNSDDKMIKATVSDGLGSFYLTSFKNDYHEEVNDVLNSIGTGDLLSVMGKISYFKNNEDIFYFSIVPELVSVISDNERRFWSYRTLYISRRKLMAIREAFKDDVTSETLTGLGYSIDEAESAIRAKKYYNNYDFNGYLQMISSINFENGIQQESQNYYDIILDYIKNNDDGTGCRYDDIVIAARNAKISQDKVDEILNYLGSQGDIYEVSLKRYKALI
ncbi:hypothetical protein [Picrophilus oshimae]|uniref:Uncharacterized protein n=1 Tax=Picrophilus torridus (strain ATCC 700027 / DSM 9790 / JCM 10055 / NBRC 100828 / KAW 2/3) TaxID=1122961 RepID=A0A8G2FWV5_PICTO|nr:hypothetical protein [Picrophilus oshimae]SMD30926.1 hypothetical protein SAMN02745355_0844 [Picrophilus oshimae DSM 9789]